MEIHRKGHTRRTVLPDAWRFHLKAMTMEDEPLRYIRRFLLIEEDLSGIQFVSDEETADTENSSHFYEDLLWKDENEDFSVNG